MEVEAQVSTAFPVCQSESPWRRSQEAETLDQPIGREPLVNKGRAL